MEDKFISIEDLIRIQEASSKDYNQYVGYLESVFRTILNPELKDDIINNKIEVIINRVRLISKDFSNLLEIEYKLKGKNDKSYLNIINENNKINISLVNDNTEITKRINRNIMPVIKETIDYASKNEYCKQNHIQTISDEVSIEIDPCDIFITHKGMQITINHSFETKKRKVEENCSCISIQNNGIRYDISEEVEINGLKKLLEVPMINIKTLPEYLKENLQVKNVKVKKRV